MVAEQFVRLLHHAGMPAEDLDFIHGNGKVVNEILLQARPRATLFTGSGRIAEKLAHDLHGKAGPHPECRPKPNEALKGLQEHFSAW